MTVRELITSMVFKVDNNSVKKVEGVTNNLKKGFSALKTGIAVGIGAALFGIGKTAFSTVAEMESLNTSFGVMLGSAEKAKDLVKDLTKFANQTPFQLTEIGQGAKTLLQFGIEAKDLMGTLNMLGDVAGNNAENFKSLTIAFGQISSKGRLTGQELNQLINAGFNPLQEISKRTGTDYKILTAQMEKGAISADMVTESFKKATSAGGMFYQNMLKQSKDLTGIWSTMKDSFALGLAAGANVVLEDVKKVMLEVNDIMGQYLAPMTTSIMKALLPVVKILGTMLKPLFQILMPVFDVLVSALEIVGRIFATSILPFINVLIKLLMPILNDIAKIIIDLMLFLEPIIGIIINLFLIFQKICLYPILLILKIFFAILKPIFGLITKFLTPIYKAYEFLTKAINWLMDSLMLFISNAIDWGFGALLDILKWVFDFVMNKLSPAFKFLGEVFSGLGEIFTNIFTKIKTFFLSVINVIIDGINWFINQVNKLPIKDEIELIKKIEADKIELIKKIEADKNKPQLPEGKGKGGINNNFNQNFNFNGVDGANTGAIREAAKAAFQLELQKILISAGV